MSEEQEDPRKPKEIHISVDSKQMETLIHANDKLQVEKEELQEQVTDSEEAKILLDDLKEKASTELTSLGVPTEIEDIKTKSDLDRAVSTIKKLREKSVKHSGNEGGSAPLNQNQYGIEKKSGYGSYEEMVTDLREKASRGDANAKEALNQLSFKVLKGVRKVNIEPYKPEPTPLVTTDLSPDLRLVQKPDVMGIQKAFRKKKLMERASKGDQTAIDVLNSGDY